MMNGILLGTWVINLVIGITSDDKNILRTIAICGSIVSIAHFAEKLF